MLRSAAASPRWARAEIKGYYTEEFTHLAVAAAIATGVADAGIGIETAARRLKLDFIPLIKSDEFATLARRSQATTLRTPEK